MKRYRRVGQAADQWVAPHTGAWIETRGSMLTDCLGVWSPPIRGRGLKHTLGYNRNVKRGSPPIRGRGLKRLLSQINYSCVACRPPYGGVD